MGPYNGLGQLYFTLLFLHVRRYYWNIQRKYSDFVSEAYDLRELPAFEKGILNHQSATSTVPRHTRIIISHFPPQTF